jgi:hypothetical protein
MLKPSNRVLLEIELNHNLTLSIKQLTPQVRGEFVNELNGKDMPPEKFLFEGLMNSIINALATTSAMELKGGLRLHASEIKINQRTKSNVTRYLSSNAPKGSSIEGLTSALELSLGEHGHNIPNFLEVTKCWQRISGRSIAASPKEEALLPLSASTSGGR